MWSIKKQTEVVLRPKISPQPDSSTSPDLKEPKISDMAPKTKPTLFQLQHLQERESPQSHKLSYQMSQESRSDDVVKDSQHQLVGGQVSSQLENSGDMQNLEHSQLNFVSSSNQTAPSDDQMIEYELEISQDSSLEDEQQEKEEEPGADGQSRAEIEKIAVQLYQQIKHKLVSGCYPILRKLIQEQKKGLSHHGERLTEFLIQPEINPKQLGSIEDFKPFSEAEQIY